MTRQIPRIISFLCFSLLPTVALAQCQDQLCRNLQYILYAAQTDFREFRGPKAPNPDVSVGGAKVPCQMSAWSNNVPMYICAGEVTLADSEEWYTKTLAALQRLQYLWHFKIDASGSDHYVDGGPADCEITPAGGDGPYLGACPLHLQAVKQPDGSAKVYLWLNSYTSPYLVPKPPPAAQKQESQSQ
jgi:hypothetical protein